MLEYQGKLDVVRMNEYTFIFIYVNHNFINHRDFCKLLLELPHVFNIIIARKSLLSEIAITIENTTNK